MMTTLAVMSSEAIKIASIRRSDINLRGTKKTAPKGRTLSELFFAGLALIRQNVVYARHAGRRRPTGENLTSEQFAISIHGPAARAPRGAVRSVSLPPNLASGSARMRQRN
jgi:hypothetical protein